MKRAVEAAVVYAALVFAAGFVLGVLRVLLLAPQLGALVAVLVELPAMLAIAWVACGFSLRRSAIRPARRSGRRSAPWPWPC